MYTYTRISICIYREIYLYIRRYMAGILAFKANSPVGTAYFQGRLDSPQAWCAAKLQVGEWFGMDVVCSCAQKPFQRQTNEQSMPADQSADMSADTPADIC